MEMNGRFAGLARTQQARIHDLRHDPQGRPIGAGTVGAPAANIACAMCPRST
jgi:hypothetical protein